MIFCLFTCVLVRAVKRLFYSSHCWFRNAQFNNNNNKLCPATRHGDAWGERRYSSYSFSTSVLDGGEWSASRPGRAFTPRERTTGTHCTGGWVGPEQIWTQRIEEKSLAPAGDRTSIARSSSPYSDTVLTELTRLHNNNNNNNNNKLVLPHT
jgi:hypothetical protein